MYIYIYMYRYTPVIISRKFRIKQTWRLAKAMAEMKSDTEQTLKLEWLHKVNFECELNS